MYKRDFIFMSHPEHGVKQVPTDQNSLTVHMAAGWMQCPPPAEESQEEAAPAAE